MTILDFHPVNEEVVATSGPEPTLRELVFKYYYRYIGDELEAFILARDYCSQIEEIEQKRLKASLKLWFFR